MDVDLRADDDLVLIVRPDDVAVADQSAAMALHRTGRRVRVLTNDDADGWMLLDAKQFIRPQCDCLVCRAFRGELIIPALPSESPEFDRSCESCADLGYPCQDHQVRA